MKPWLIAAAMAAGCSLPMGDYEPHEQAAFDALKAAWDGPKPAGYCHLDRFLVRQNNSCGPEAYGCLSWEKPRPFRADKVPVVNIATWHHSEPYLVVHELLHAFSLCAGWGGDARHVNPRVWSAAGGDSSIQSRTMAVLASEGWI